MSFNESDATFRAYWNEMFKELCKNIIEKIDVLDKKIILFITEDLEKDELTLINEILLKKLKKSLKLFSIYVIVETINRHNNKIYKVENATS